jgi:hypothetical protein
MSNGFVEKNFQVMGLSQLPAFRKQVSFEVFLDGLLDIDSGAFQILQAEKVFCPFQLLVSDPVPIVRVF